MCIRDSWIPKLLRNIDICTLPDDHNPGVSNAFMYGGFLCGILSLRCELAKGFIPVYLGQKCLDINSLLFVPVLVAPVFGLSLIHICGLMHPKWILKP